MIQPFLDGNGAASEPGGVQARGAAGVVVTVVVVMMTMRVAVAVLEQRLGGLGVEEEVGVEGLAAADAHEDAAKQQHAGDTQGAKALNLAVPLGKLAGGRAQTPRDGGQRQDVRGQVGERMPGVGDHGLRIEGVAAGALGDGHAQVRVQANASDAHAGVILVGGGEVDVIMVVVVMMMMESMVMVVSVTMASVATCLLCRTVAHCAGWRVVVYLSWPGCRSGGGGGSGGRSRRR